MSGLEIKSALQNTHSLMNLVVCSPTVRNSSGTTFYFGGMGCLSEYPWDPIPLDSRRRFHFKLLILNYWNREREIMGKKRDNYGHTATKTGIIQ